MSGIVAFVLNDARHDSRVLREAATLAAAGHDVTILARTVDPYSAELERTTTAEGVPLVRIPVASGPLRWLHLARRPGRLIPAAAVLATRNPVGFIGALVVALVVAPVVLVGVLLLAIPIGLAFIVTRLVPPVSTLWRGLSWHVSWRLAVMPWARAAAAAARAEVPDATVYWAHDLRALPAAIEARDSAGRGTIIYDAHEIFAEAGENARRPAWARRQINALERRLATRATALVTVNELLAERLGPALEISQVVVARNCPPRWTPPSGVDGSPLREAARVPAGTPLLLYHGGLAAGRGIEQLAAAIDAPGLERAHIVFMGNGPATEQVDALARGSEGRIHRLPPVSPAHLSAWVAGADVVVAPIQPTTLNHRFSSPNKVFEGIASGVPVVGSDLPGIRSVILADPDEPLGAVVDPADSAALARAIASIVSLPPSEAAALRARCLAAAHARWNWEIESQGLVALASELDGPAAPGSTQGVAGAAAGLGAAAGSDGAAAGPDVRQTPQQICFVLASTGEFDARTRRLAMGLADRGHAVTVLARAGHRLAAEDRMGPSVVVRRVDVGGEAVQPVKRAVGPWRAVLEARRLLAVIGRVRRQTRAVRDVALAPDVVHAMGFLALPVALDLARRTRARLIYDARDLYVESNNIARLPGPLRLLFAWREGRWARAADRILTVNESCADYLERRYRVRRPVVVMNGQLPWAAPDKRPNLIRERLGIPESRTIALYHGGFMPDRGLYQVVAAAGEPGLETTDFVFMGTGPIEAPLRALAAAAAHSSRLRFLPPVSPDHLLDWVASADVGVMPNQPRTLNERLSTPNKLFECLAAGTPVVSSDFSERRRIILEGPDGPLGRVCDPMSPASIGAAIRALIELGPDEAADLRARCRHAAQTRFGWTAQFERALEAYEGVTGRAW